MARYLIHFSETRYYTAIVDADDDNEAEAEGEAIALDDCDEVGPEEGIRREIKVEEIEVADAE